MISLLTTDSHVSWMPMKTATLKGLRNWNQCHTEVYYSRARHSGTDYIIFFFSSKETLD